MTKLLPPASNASVKKVTYVLFVSDLMLGSETQRRQLSLTIKSVLNQSVDLYDLLILSSKKFSQSLNLIIHDCLAKLNDNIYVFLDRNQFITKTKKSKKSELYVEDTVFIVQCQSDNYSYKNALDSIKNLVQTEWVVFLNNTIHVATHATYELTRTILESPSAELIYGDHDQVNSKGFRSCPSFKPIFSLDLLYSQNYIGSFFAIKTKIINITKFTNEYKYFSNFTFSIILYLVEYLSEIPAKPSKLRSLTNKIIHVPSVFHSEREQSFKRVKITDQCSEQFEILKLHLNSLHPDVICSQIKPFIFRHKWPVSETGPLVSLIIPTKDGFDILKACIESVINKTTYLNYEIIVVDNQSTDIKTLNYLNNIVINFNNFKVIKYEKKFNYSDINNIAVKHAKGTILGFLNNDTEVINPDWLTEMVSHAIRPDIGCVGSMHFYPDNHIQHAGVIVGMHGVADHAFKGLKKSSRHDKSGYLNSIRNPDAVTAATLLVKRELFNLVGGFDSEHLKIAFNDVDLCLKIANRGYRCLWTPFAELYHYESKTRHIEKSDDFSKRVEQFEHSVMKKRWGTDRIPARDLLRSFYL